ncbi:MAG: GIY-YIG nuclease family protein [Pseudomonadota bacterium]|nr:GIY-YIG nuclease family protein [Pseudomonadota bacterium]
MIRQETRDPCRVYFIRPVGMDGPIKIGCSNLPDKRLKAMSYWSPVPLEILATINGDEKLEQRFHAAFESDRSHGEWFAASAELLAAIEQIKAGVFDVAALPKGKRLCGNRSGNGWSEFSRFSAAINARLRALYRRGVAIPADIEAKAFRYNSGRHYPHLKPHVPADGHDVQRFLAGHGYTPLPVPNDDTQSSEAA